MAHIAIVGLGMIGGSLGLALRQAKVDVQIVGHDLDPEVATKARKRGAVDKTEWNLPAALDGAGLVVVAVPFDALQTVFAHLAPHLTEGCVVTDTASVKHAPIVWAAESFPPHASFVGGHPIPNKAGTGIDNARPDLFQHQAYCLTPGTQSDSKAVDLIAELVAMVGATPYFLDPEEHDSFAALTSDLPFLAATALLNVIPADPASFDHARLVTPHFSAIASLTPSSSAACQAICDANRDAILRWLDAYTRELAALRTAIAGDASGASLELALRRANESRQRLQKGGQTDGHASSLPKPGEILRHMLMGGFRERKRR